MDKLYKLFVKALADAASMVVILCVWALLAALPVQWTWNEVMPDVFRLEEIGFWQAFCLCWLSGALLKEKCQTARRKPEER